MSAKFESARPEVQGACLNHHILRRLQCSLN